MILYHGSKDIIVKPQYGGGKLHNDYGRGFYCTEDIGMASEWAVDENRDGYVNTYTIETDRLSIIDLNSKDFTILHWISVLISNRIFELNSPLAREAYRYLTENFYVDVTSADIIRGYRADDSYFAFAQDFLNGQISLSQLSKALYLGKLGEQIVIKSKRTFNRLKYVGSSEAFSNEWFQQKKARDNRARLEYKKMGQANYIPGDLYITRIIDEEIKANDPRIQ